MKLPQNTKTAAQARADQIHAWMIANSPPYADSVAKGHTLRWAIPFEDAGKWAIHTKPRCQGALTQAERDAQVGTSGQQPGG